MSQTPIEESEVCEGELVPEPGAWLEDQRSRDLEHASSERLPLHDAAIAVQTAALVAGGFVAGAVTVALLRRYGQPRPERPLLGPGAGSGRQLPGETRMFVVSVRRVV